MTEGWSVNMEEWHAVLVGNPHPARFNSMLSWCQRNLGPANQAWTHHWGHDGYSWRFARREDQVMFAMVWL
jgi:hypothetical protein